MFYCTGIMLSRNKVILNIIHVYLLQVFDYSIDSETHEFCKWSDIIPSYTGTPHVGIPSDAYVHTVHAEVRKLSLMRFLFAEVYF